MIKNRRVAVTENLKTADGCNDLEGHEATCSVLYVSIWECCPTHAKTGRLGTMALLRQRVTCWRCRALFASMKARLGN